MIGIDAPKTLKKRLLFILGVSSPFAYSAVVSRTHELYFGNAFLVFEQSCPLFGNRLHAIYVIVFLAFVLIALIDSLCIKLIFLVFLLFFVFFF